MLDNNEKHRRWYKNNPGRQNELNKAWRKKNPKAQPTINRKAYLKRTYGLLEEDYNRMVMEQGDVCAICKLPFIKIPHVDHDHATGTIRGILCRDCNTGLGNFKDNIKLLESAIAYLRK